MRPQSQVWFHIHLAHPERTLAGLHIAGAQASPGRLLMDRVVIVGGGITGLAAAWELQQRGVPYTLLEASDRLGGKIVTTRAGGFVIEGGADSFLSQKPWAWQLCREIGLGDDLIGTNDERRNTYVLRRGTLHPLPRGLRLIVPLDPAGLWESDLLSEDGKRRMLAETEVPPRAEDGDESLAAFVRRRFGEEALAVFGEALLAGIHVADPATLSLRATFPQYVTLEATHGSVTRGLYAAPTAAPAPDAPSTMFVSLRGGMEELIQGLRARLTGDVRTECPVSGLGADGTIVTSDGTRIAADAVILTAPAAVAGEMVSACAPELSAGLARLHTTSSATVSLGYRDEDLARPLDGFGFVVAGGEPTHLLACTWSSTKLDGRAPGGHALLRVFAGGYRYPKDVELPDEALIGLARDELAKVMGLTAAPVVARVFRWSDANPQYEVGHVERVTRLRALCPPWLRLAGCAYDGVGIPDCVRQGREAARSISA